MSYDYFYGQQADSFSFFRIPRVLVTGEDFRELSIEAKFLYSLLLDRMGLSVRNGWFDEAGRVYIYYTIEEIQADLGCGHVKAGNLLAELDTQKGVGLIERVKQGQGKPTKIYVKQFTKPTLPELPRPEPHSNISRPTKNVCLESSKRDVKSDSFDSSRPTESVGADLQEMAANYTDKNNTDFSYTYPSIYPQEIDGGMDYNECVELVKEQLDYPLLAESYPYDDPDALVELICDVLCCTSPTMRIGSEVIPTPKIQARYRRLSFEHLAYVLDSMRETTTKIHNIKAYLLRALYDAPLTMGHFYSAAVRHDDAQC